MPNHVTNIITGSPEALASLLSPSADKSEEDLFVDFNKIIPCPENDDPIFTASFTDYGNGMQGWSMDGYSPMEWAREHWGTKWNGYSSVVEEGSVQFDTAWSHPSKIVMALSLKHPDEVFNVQYADEDLGSNFGQYQIKNGVVTDTLDFNAFDYDKARDFAAEVKYGMSYAELSAEWGD